MGAISSIRKRSGIIVFIIGFAMVLFVVTSALDNNLGVLGGPTDKVAKIKGKSITGTEFNIRVQNEIKIIKLRNDYTGQVSNITDDVYQQVRDFTWTNIIKEIILDDEINYLGISLTDEELNELVYSSDPHPIIQQFPFFINNETAAFDPALMGQFFEYLKTELTGEPLLIWDYYRKFVYRDKLESKYFNAFVKGMFVSPWQAKEDFLEKNQKAEIKYVFINYNTVTDESILVEETDINSYALKHNNVYAKEIDTRQINYVAFNIFPTRQDSIDCFDAVLAQQDNFLNAENDSIFIVRNSEADYDGTYHLREDLETGIADSLFRIDSGAVIGPFEENGSFVTVKLLDKKLIPDSVKVRHILFSLIDQQDYLNKLSLADSLIENLRNGEATFFDLAAEYSSDQANSADTGNLGWVQPNDMVKPFNDAIFYRGKEGDLLKVLTNFGLHLIEIQESNPTLPAVKIGYLSQELRAGLTTERQIWDMVNSFASKNDNADAYKETFDHLTQTSIVVKSSPEPFKVEDYIVPGLGNARAIVQWAFNAKEGDISQVFTYENQFVIVHLEKMNKIGSVDIDEVRTEIELLVRSEKKAKKILDDIEALLQNVDMNDINAIGTALSQDVSDASNITFGSPFIPGVGQEVKATGVIFGSQVGSVTKPIEGENGILIIQVVDFTPAPESQDYLTTREQLEQNYVTRTQAQLVDGLKKRFGFKDTRYKAY